MTLEFVQQTQTKCEVDYICSNLFERSKAFNDLLFEMPIAFTFGSFKVVEHSYFAKFYNWEMLDFINIYDKYMLTIE